MKQMAGFSSRQYPNSEPRPAKRTTVIRKKERPKTPPYLKDTLRKNGALIKRPTIRPTNLSFCINDKIHYEWFKRFAKEKGFEKDVLFWKSVEAMKEIEDPRQQQAKIKSIISQYFPRGINTLNTDGQIIQEILKLSNSPEKVSISMIISAQNCVMKSMESKYGEEYLRNSLYS